MTRPRPSLDVSAVLIEPPPQTTGTASGTPIDLTGLFANDRPVELEIGSGKGLFLANAGVERPDHNFLGVELSHKYARLAAERLVKKGLSNVKVWPGDAGVVTRVIPDASLVAIHVYFPDPWWKKRHKKRRVFNEALVVQMSRTLLPGGLLNVATDVEEYFEVIRGLISAEPRLSELPTPVAKDPENDLDYLTNFERKFRIEGRPIYRASYMNLQAN